MRELTELITKITEIQLKEISDTLEKAKQIMSKGNGKEAGLVNGERLSEKNHNP